MIHRRNRQNDGAGTHGKHIGGTGGHGVQHVGTVAVLHALGIAGGTAGVAQARRRIFRHVGPRRIHALGRQQILITEQVQAGFRHVGTIRKQHEMLDRGKTWRQFLNQLHKRQIEKQHPVFSVVGDVDDLLFKQARVDGVGNAAHAGNAIPAFDMAPGVPSQRGDAIAGLHAQPPQRARHLLGAAAHSGPVGAMLGPFAAQRHDLALTMINRRVIDQLAHQQRPILHRSQHARPPQIFSCSAPF